MAESAAHADAFYKEVLARGEVWAIRDINGFPAPAGTDSQRAMPFWSTRTRAERVIQRVDGYAEFEPIAIPLPEWHARWLVGLARDGLLVGLNWSGDRATGYDVTPDEVVSALDARST